MHPIARLACAALLSTAALAAHAQGASPAKKELVQKVLTLQQQGIEGIGNALAMQTSNQVLNLAGQAMGRVPEDKRQALGTEMQADVKKFFDEIAPLLRSAAMKNAPGTIGTALEEKFSEDELKTLIAWLESPVSKKFQQISGELQQQLSQKVVGDTRAAIEPKLKTLEQTLGNRLRAAAGEAQGGAPAAGQGGGQGGGQAGGQGAAAPRPAAAPARPPASAPAKK